MLQAQQSEGIDTVHGMLGTILFFAIVGLIFAVWLVIRITKPTSARSIAVGP